MRITDKYVFFWGGEYSQWYPSVFKDEQGQQFVTAEQYMMYHKALTFGDEKIAKEILATRNPKEQKRLGRLVQNFDAAKWDEVKFDIVVQGNILKFSQDPLLLELLKAHQGKTFVEASPEDKIWGIGLWEGDERVLDESKWRGQNLLGKAINEAQKQLL